MEILCNSRVCLLPQLPAQVLEAFRQEFTYTHRKYIRGKDAWAKFGASSGSEFTRRTFLIEESNGTLALPAGFAEKASGMLKHFGYTAPVKYSGFSDLKADWPGLLSRITFRESQEETLRLLFDNYFGGLDAAPGYGKGFLIRCICHLYPDAKIDITTDSTVVCRNLQDYLEPYIPDVGFVGDGTKIKGKRVTIYTTDSLHHSTGDADILIVDEVHMVVTEKACPKFSMYKKARRYWFSATPEGRADNSDARVEALFGPTRKVISYQDCVRMGLIVNLRVNWIDMNRQNIGWNPIEGISSKDDVPRLGIWRNAPRNQLFSQVINSIHPDSQTLVLVSKVEHLCHLFPYLNGFQLAFGAGDSSIKEAAYWASFGKIPKDCLESRKAKNQQMRLDYGRGILKKMLVTSIWDTGANFPELSDIFRVDPYDGGTIKDTQAPGRGSRLFDDKTHAVLHDAVDRFDPRLYDIARRKRSNYKSQGWDEYGWVDKDQ